MIPGAYVPMTTSLTVDLTPSRPVQGLDILILDDSDIDRIRLRRFLSQAGIEASVVDCDTVESFAGALEHTFFDAVLIDYRLGARNGIEALNLLRGSRAQRRAAAIMVTGDTSIDLAVEVMRTGCDDFVIKETLDPHRMRTSLARAISHRKADGIAGPGGTSAVMALRNAVETGAAEMAGEVRSALSAVAGRSRALRATHSADPQILAQLAHIDSACARAWSMVGAFQQNLGALDMTRPRATKLGLTRRGAR